MAGQITRCPTKKDRNVWRIRWDGPSDQFGNRKRLHETVRGTKKEAQAILDKNIATVEGGSYVDKSRATVSQLMEAFLNKYCVLPTVRIRTKQGYQHYINRHVNPSIGHVAYQKLTPQQIRDIYAGMLERGLSHTTVLHLHRLLRKVFKWAVEEEMISANPTDKVKAPERDTKQMDMWPLEVIHKFLDLAVDSKYGDVFNFAIHTGMRRSEICGLKWRSVDLAENRLRVENVLHYIYGPNKQGDGSVNADPKTAKSSRTIMLAPETVALLHAIRGRQMELGLPTTEDAYVFSRVTGQPLIPDEVTKEFTRFIRSWNLPHMTFHGLRHCFATLGLLAGIPTKVVSESLGHSTIQITNDLYQHVLPNMLEEHVNLISNLLKRQP